MLDREFGNLMSIDRRQLIKECLHLRFRKLNETISGESLCMPIRSIIDWLGFHKVVQAPPEARAQFQLFYEDLLVGTLSVADGTWRFEYSQEFKKQDDLRPLVEFPDVEQVYESKELWQFFVMRIPSPEQAEVEEILKREHIEEDDAVSLLKRFGERTIANPFRLEAA